MKKSISLITALTVSLLSFSTMSSSGASAKANEPVEILSLRSEYGKHFDNGDGTMTSYVNTAPIHYLEDGEWVEINNSLVIDENNYYTNVSNPLKVTIPSKLSISDSSSIGLVSNGSSIQIPLDDLIKNVADEDKESFDASVNDVSDTKIEKDLPDALLDSFNNNVSSISYNLADNYKDLTLEIHPDSLVETLTFDKGATLPATLSYPVKSADLDIKINDDSNIEFVESDGSVAFTMIAPVIYDSSDDHNYSPIAIDLIESDDGCYVSFSLEDAINALDAPVYPLILSTGYTVQRSANTRYNSESSPYENITDQYMRIGNVDGNGFQTFVSCGDSFTGYSGNVTITDASFNMYLVGNYLSSPKTLKVYSMNSEPMNCSWNYASSLNNNNTYITAFNVAYSEMYSWKEVDITKLAQSWLNYGKTSQNVGVASYGFKIITESTPKATVVANSERASYNHPYFEINYVVDSDYTLTYAPHKYNNIDSNNYSYGKIYNFQNKMNCYAYALQVYYRGSGDYYLKPGEFGISEHIPSFQFISDTNKSNYTYNFSNYGELNAQYSTFLSSLDASSSGMNIFAEFIEEQMYKDSQAMNFQLKKLELDDFYFSTPEDYDEESERIIAMITYRLGNYSPDYHFYLRNGNGTCQTHGGNCSIWTHKVGNDVVQNTSYHPADTDLCDQNINFRAKFFTMPWNQYHVSDVNYYRITKATNTYNSYHGYGQFDSSTGTPYYSY